ncbi:MAG: hypothetical protein JWP38_1775 [Herbaspirillum sp.]|nr:hypothetical protein [Herbaspirillum sp.]
MIRSTFAAAIVLAWVYQFIGHRIWRYLPYVSQDHTGLPIAIAVLLCMTLPFVFVKRLAHAANGFRFDRRADGGLLLLLAAIAALNWLVFVSHWTTLPLHTYGDEFFHNERTLIEYNYWHDLLHPVPGKDGLEFPSAHFIFYPSVAYFTTTILTWLQGDPASIVYQRNALLIWLFPIPMAAYMLGRALEIARRLSFLFALALAVSPLLASFMLSYYIEIPYISIELMALAWLVRGEKNQDAYALCLAVGLASVATLVRESTLPFAFFMVAAALYCSSRFSIERAGKIALQAWFVFAGLMPCVLYSYAKLCYAGPQSTRLAMTNLLHQDWWLLLTYGLLYLNPIVLLFALAAWRFIVRPKTRMLLVTMTAALVGTLFMYGMFEPGWMPWSRNYALLLAPTVALALAGLYWLADKFNSKVTQSILIGGSLVNLVFASLYFTDNRLFHENEAIFDLAPALAQLGQLKGTVKVYEHRPVFMRNQLVMPSNITLVNLAPEISTFMPLSDIESRLPSDARWILYYYYQNAATPWKLRTASQKVREISPQLHPAAEALRSEMENGNYVIRSLNNDPFSDGRTGVALLERKDKR